ncbi:hypothetical protein BH10BAC5_BH10BAC5_01460 [soil metagenome]
MPNNRTELIKEKLTSFKLEFSDVNGTLLIVTPIDLILDICKILKSELSFDQCRDAVGIDRFTKKNRYEIIYNLYSLFEKDRIFVKVIIDGKEPVSKSISGIWKSADWYEREAFDMIGIKFEGHPDMRRIYMPEEFEYHPLRKDFPLMGIPDSIPLPNK